MAKRSCCDPRRTGGREEAWEFRSNLKATSPSAVGKKHGSSAEQIHPPPPPPPLKKNVISDTLSCALLTDAGVYVLSTNLFREYHYVSSPKTWAEAQRYCRERYADLATVDSPEENDRLLLELQGSGQFAWIGLYDNTTGWKWTMGDDDFVGDSSFPPWEPNQPDNYGGKQSCIVMNLIGGWRDEICNTERPFICFDGR
uniref:C-type lectin domain-containing protein n=1 Tax=Xiphophorus couchianus TaxID=32473 RepID=A0A3B5L935_9TELE